MAFILRVIVNPRWSRPSWLADGDAPADALSDLKTTNNELSVWRVDDERSNLQDVLTALASNRQRLDKLDYALLPEDALPRLEVRCVTNEAETAHMTANAAHRDLVDMSATKVARLAAELMPLRKTRIPESEVTTLLINALQQGSLDRARLEAALLSQIEAAAARRA